MNLTSTMIVVSYILYIQLKCSKRRFVVIASTVTPHCSECRSEWASKVYLSLLRFDYLHVSFTWQICLWLPTKVSLTDSFCLCLSQSFITWAYGLQIYTDSKIILHRIWQKKNESPFWFIVTRKFSRFKNSNDIFYLHP